MAKLLVYIFFTWTVRNK